LTPTAALYIFFERFFGFQHHSCNTCVKPNN
jgi:hypothetical protein